MGHHEHTGEIEPSNSLHLVVATLAAVALPLLPAVLAWFLIFSQ